MSRGRFVLPILAASLLMPQLLSADDISAVKAEVLEMRGENRVLRARIEEQEKTIEDLLKRIEELESSRERGEVSNSYDSTEPGSTESAPPEQDPIVPTDDTSQPPSLFIRGFADVNFAAYSDEDEATRSGNSFFLDEFDFLLTAQLSPEFSALGEVAFHFAEMEQDAFLEVERLYLRYSPSDSFGLRGGRVHTPIGYWNRTYHHGSWFQPTISRPEVHRWEDDGGILPVHSIGAEAYGKVGVRSLDMKLSALVANGRGENINEVQNLNDLNTLKALNFHINFESTSRPGLQFGLTSYLDAFAQSPGDTLRVGEMDEKIFMGHLIYLPGQLEFLTEVAYVIHDEAESGRRFDHMGLYIQGGYRFRKWNPYYRWDFMDIDESDPVYTGRRQDIDKHTFGARWDVITWAALKFEYRFGKQGGATNTHTGIIQSAFVF